MYADMDVRRHGEVAGNEAMVEERHGDRKVHERGGRLRNTIVHPLLDFRQQDTPREATHTKREPEVSDVTALR